MTRTFLKRALITTFFTTSFSAHAAVTLLDHDDWKISMGGFAAMDAIYDSTRSLNELPGNAPIDRPNSIPGANGRTQFTVRQSRLAFSIIPPVEGTLRTKGYLELDFSGGTPNGNAAENQISNLDPRIRLATITAESGNLQILVGQAWSLFGWQPTYILTTASQPPVQGEAFARIAQVAVTHAAEIGTGSRLQSAISVTRPPQRDAVMPGIDLGIKISTDSRKGGFNSEFGERKPQPMSLALSGTVRQFETPKAGGAFGDTSHFPGAAFAVDGMLPIIASEPGAATAGNTLALSGEFTRGRGYSDYLPGWTGNLGALAASSANPNLDAGIGGFDSNGAFQLVQVQSFNLQLQYHLPADWKTFADLGMTQTYSNNIANLTVAPTKVAYDRTQQYFGNIFHDFTEHVRGGVELAQLRTYYVDGQTAHDNRVQFAAYFLF